jgi:hypothetical protein
MKKHLLRLEEEEEIFPFVLTNPFASILFFWAFLRCFKKAFSNPSIFLHRNKAYVLEKKDCQTPRICKTKLDVRCSQRAFCIRLHMWTRLPALFIAGNHSLLRKVGFEKSKGLPYLNIFQLWRETCLLGKYGLPKAIGLTPHSHLQRKGMFSLLNTLANIKSKKVEVIVCEQLEL